MTNFAHGREAEAAAARFLERQGYKVIAQNWRTKACEIDIVATKHRTAYCVEVKYRQNDNQGSGLDYITPTKQKQMYFAAEMWAAVHKWNGDITLGAVEIQGPDYHVSEFIESIL